MGSLFGVYLIMDVGRGTWDVGRGTWDVGRGTWDVGTWGRSGRRLSRTPSTSQGVEVQQPLHALRAALRASGGPHRNPSGDTGTADGETTMTVAGRGYAPFVRSF